MTWVVFKRDLAALADRINYRNIEIDLSEKQDGSKKKNIRKKRPLLLWFSIIVVMVLFGVSFIFIPSNNFDLTLEGVADTFKKLFVLNPNSYASLQTQSNWNKYLWETAVPEVLSTAEMCFIATLLGSILSIPLFYLAARNVSKHPYIYQPVRIITDLIRTIPTMVLAVLAIYFVGQDSPAGIFAMTIFTAGIMYQLMYEYVETLEMSPFEAVQAAGGRTLQNVNRGLRPEIKPMFLANFLYTFEINIRASVVLGYVGAGGFGYELNERIANEQYDRVGCLLIPLFILVVILQVASNIVSRKLK